jgi:predicted TIM-barrel enzyme
LIVGSGVNADTLAEYSIAEAWIVGTALKRDGLVQNEVELARVREMCHASSDGNSS